MDTFNYLNLSGLFFGACGALIMFFYPPLVTQYTADGEKIINWNVKTNDEDKTNFKIKSFLSNLGPFLLVIGFTLQIISTFYN
jgi:hypothetical protein